MFVAGASRGACFRDGNVEKKNKRVWHPSSLKSVLSCVSDCVLAWWWLFFGVVRGGGGGGGKS